MQIFPKCFIKFETIADLNGKHHLSLFSQNELQMIASGYYGYIVLFRSLFSVLFLDIITTMFFTLLSIFVFHLNQSNTEGLNFYLKLDNRVTRTNHNLYEIDILSRSTLKN